MDFLAHGVLIEHHGIGVLICGPSGSGKSDAALELLQLGAHLICDDAPQYEVKDNSLWGFCDKKFQGALHLRSLGIIQVKDLWDEERSKAKTSLKLMIELSPIKDHNEGHLKHLHHYEPQYETINYHGITLTKLRLLINSQRPIGLLLDVAIRQFKQHLS